MPELLYFTASDGTVYRVLDSTIRDGVSLIANPPAPWATARLFRSRNGAGRLYRMETEADRATDDATLERQLRTAGYLPARPPHDGANEPGRQAREQGG